MELTQLQRRMKELYRITLEYEFHKSTYEKKMDSLIEEQRDLLEEIAHAWDSFPDERDRIAGIIPEYAATEIKAEPSKRKRDFKLLDYKMNMVSWFIPLLGEMPSENSAEMTQRIIDIWNEKMPGHKIGHSTYQSIKSGFRRGISCYISTAVCRSLGKEDDCHELEILRTYRDRYLMADDGGKELVREYYNIAPTIVKRIDRKSDADRIYFNIWNEYLKPCINFAELGKNEACREKYTEMVKKLESEYLFS